MSRARARHDFAVAAVLAAFGCQAPRSEARALPSPGPAPPAESAPAIEPAPPGDAPPKEPAWPPAPPGVQTDFCLEVVTALDEETCYVLPDAPTGELLVYLHGILPPARDSKQKANLETVVANACRRAGVAALIPRGRLGLAPRGHEDWWGWPTTASAHQKLAGEIVAELGAKQSKLERLTGRPFTRVYVAGSSSGAYFAAALALQGDIEADAFGALSGGAARARTRLRTLAPKPFYIGFGSFDTVGGAARALGNQLRGAGWPVKVAAHPKGHGAKEIYLDEAFAFWRAELDRPPAGAAVGAANGHL